MFTYCNLDLFDTKHQRRYLLRKNFYIFKGYLNIDRLKNRDFVRSSLDLFRVKITTGCC